MQHKSTTVIAQPFPDDDLIIDSEITTTRRQLIFLIIFELALHVLNLTEKILAVVGHDVSMTKDLSTIAFVGTGCSIFMCFMLLGSVAVYHRISILNCACWFMIQLISTIISVSMVNVLAPSEMATINNISISSAALHTLVIKLASHFFCEVAIIIYSFRLARLLKITEISSIV